MSQDAAVNFQEYRIQPNGRAGHNAGQEILKSPTCDTKCMNCIARWNFALYAYRQLQFVISFSIVLDSTRKHKR